MGILLGNDVVGLHRQTDSRCIYKALELQRVLDMTHLALAVTFGGFGW